MYQQKKFTVPASSEKAPANCAHAWVDEKRKRCVLCGEKVANHVAWLVGTDTVSNAVFTGEQALAIHKEIVRQYRDEGEGPE
jgi:hypothetical protein